MELEVFDGWTIDRRLKQLRKIDANDKILFVDFDSDLGQAIFEKKLLLEQKSEQELDYDFNLHNFLSADEDERCLLALQKAIFEVNKVIKKLERELK